MLKLTESLFQLINTLGISSRNNRETMFFRINIHATKKSIKYPIACSVWRYWVKQFHYHNGVSHIMSYSGTKVKVNKNRMKSLFLVWLCANILLDYIRCFLIGGKRDLDRDITTCHMYNINIKQEESKWKWKQKTNGKTLVSFESFSNSYVNETNVISIYIDSFFYKHSLMNVNKKNLGKRKFLKISKFLARCQVSGHVSGELVECEIEMLSGQKTRPICLAKNPKTRHVCFVSPSLIIIIIYFPSVFYWTIPLFPFLHDGFRRGISLFITNISPCKLTNKAREQN